ALLFVIHGDYARALKDCDRAIHIEKHHPDYYLTRARAYIGLHQDAKALKDLSRAIALDDQNSEYRLERAAQLTKERKFKNALEDVSVALEQDEDNCDALRLRAKIYHGMKKLTLAKHDLKRVKEITDALHNGPLD
ncbi:MAG TPA: tetratricopeptide repeat protein, partial [Chroococcales cyanobacterium]